MKDGITTTIDKGSDVAVAMVMGLPVLFEGRPHKAQDIRENDDGTITAELYPVAPSPSQTPSQHSDKE